MIVFDHFDYFHYTIHIAWSKQLFNMAKICNLNRQPNENLTTAVNSKREGESIPHFRTKRAGLK